MERISTRHTRTKFSAQRDNGQGYKKKTSDRGQGEKRKEYRREVRDTCPRGTKDCLQVEGYPVMRGQELSLGLARERRVDILIDLPDAGKDRKDSSMLAERNKSLAWK